MNLARSIKDNFQRVKLFGTNDLNDITDWLGENERRKASGQKIFTNLSDYIQHGKQPKANS